MIRARLLSLSMLLAATWNLQADNSPAITVRVYNLAQIPPDELSRAMSEAVEIFTRAGVALIALDCSVPNREPRCRQVDRPSILNLRLMPPNSELPNLPRGVFGFALMSTSGGFARTANVYLGRLREIADGRKHRLDVVLGAMVAHEIGHLLLGPGEHSNYGLMSSPWTPGDIVAADRSMLSFAKREVTRIHEAVRDRQSRSN